MARCSIPLSFACKVSAIFVAISLSTAKMSVNLRSYFSAHRCESFCALISCLLHCAFENVRDAKLLRYFGKIGRSTFVTLRGSARDHLEVGDLRQSRENLFLNAIGKIGVVRIVTKIFERQ